MSELQYTTVDRIFAKFYRDLKNIEINESDAIEWIGEALDDLKLPQSQEQAVAFIEVKDYQTDLPCNFQMVLQIARNNKWNKERSDKIIKDIKKEKEEEKESFSVALDCNGEIIGDYDVAYYRPFFDLQWKYGLWTSTNYYKNNFTPVRLASHTFFNTFVCKEKESPYKPKCKYDEYTIIGTTNKKLRFSFKEGQIALSYLKTAIDKRTGYPLVPDNKSAIRAITYFLKFKIAEWYNWNGREGYQQEEKKAFELYQRYVRQFNNYIKMPKSIDDFQDLLEQSHYLIPRHKRYYGFFGNLNKAENKKFNDPDYRLKNI